MGWLDILTGGIAGRVIDRVGDMLPNRTAERQQEHDRAMGQQATNTAEVQSASSGPVGILRSWRGALGWGMTIAVVWHVVARPLLMAIFPSVGWPGYTADDMGMIVRLLVGMLGLGM